MIPSDSGERNAEVKDLIVAIPVVVVIFVARWVLSFPFSILARILMTINAGKDYPDRHEKQVKSFCKRFFFLVYHVSSCVFCWYSFGGETWWFNREGVVEIDPSTAKYSHLLRIYYNIEAGFYLNQLIDIFILRYVYDVKKEFIEMLLHHVITLVLIICSYFSGLAQMGVVTLYLHITTDSVMYFLRATNDVKFMLLCLIALIVTTLSWAYGRLYLLPYYIIIPYFEMNKRLWNEDGAIVRLGLLILLISLIFLNAYWVYGLCKVIYNIFSEGVKAESDRQADIKKDEKED